MSRLLASTPAVLKDGTLAPWFRDLLLSILNTQEANVDAVAALEVKAADLESRIETLEGAP